jgi:predicted nucleotidyltransferase
MELQADIREFVELLLSEKVEFLLVGGYALAFHGCPRFTEDIDFLVMVSPENAERLERVLDRFGFSALGITRDDFLKPDYVIQLGRAPNRIDLLTGIDGLTWDTACESRETVDLGGLTIDVIGKEALIRNKRATGRTQDLADAERLEQPNESA